MNEDIRPNDPSKPTSDSSLPYNKAIFLGLVAVLIISLIVSAPLFSVSADETGHVNGFMFIMFSIGISLFSGVIVSILVIDWKGLFTLEGLIKWKQMSNNKRFWMGCLFYVVFPIFLCIYLVRVGLKVFQTREPVFSKEWHAPEPIKRRAKIGTITGAIVALVFAVFATTGAANIKADTSSTDVTPTVAQSLGTPTPMTTPILTPSPTVKPTPTHVLQWTVVQTFQGYGNKKTQIFTVPDDWRLVWSCNPSSFDSLDYNVIVEVDNADGSVLDYNAINTLCKSGNTGDFTEEHQGGDIYLNIQSEAAWAIKVEVLQ